MTAIQEKRRDERIELEAPVLLTSGKGISRDISGSGIYFLTEQNLTHGGVLNFAVKLEYACPGKTVTLECRGEVLRVETSGEKYGVAASIRECWCTH